MQDQEAGPVPAFLLAATAVARAPRRRASGYRRPPRRSRS